MPTKEEIEERKHFFKILQAFKNYERDSKNRLERTKLYYERIPTRHKNLLAEEGFEDHLDKIKKCIETNYKLILQLIDGVDRMFENQSHDIKEIEKEETVTASMDMEKVQSTIKQFVRDWSKDGETERDMCYKPILEEIEAIYGDLNTAQRNGIKILVPGSGLGRLAYEIASRGYVCQGNEFSLYMLIASNYVLNKCKSKNCYTIHPWVHQYVNVVSQEDQIKPIIFPDIDPSDFPNESNFSMVAGDFLEVYGNEEYFSSQDCVVTCFFIDCAHNIVEFIELIHKVLKPGGKWINFGPLLYHFADFRNEVSIEPSYDIVKGVIQKSGFEFQNEKTGCKANYCQNPASMLKYSYDCVFFTCIKK